MKQPVVLLLALQVVVVGVGVAATCCPCGGLAGGSTAMA
jgi:hypothetical protein